MDQIDPIRESLLQNYQVTRICDNYLSFLVTNALVIPLIFAPY